MFNHIGIGATLGSVGSSMSNGMNSLAAGNMALNIALYDNNNFSQFTFIVHHL
jgi:hypothetical protein